MRERLLNWLIHMATRRRKMVLISSVALTLALGGVSSLLKIDMRWSALLPETMPVVQEYQKIDNNFYQPGNMIVAISGPDPVLLEQITDEATEILQHDLVCEQSFPIDQCIKEERYAHYIYGGMPVEWLTEHAIRLAKPNDARRMKDLFSDPRLLSYLTHLNDDFEAEYTDSENVKNQERQIVSSLDAVQNFVKTLDVAANGQEIDEQEVARLVRDLAVGNPYMRSLDNSMSLLMVSSAVPTDDFEHTPLLDKRIEKLLAPLDANYPDFRIERTGLTAVGRDEMDSIGPITTLITLGAVVIVFLLLVWNFRSFLIPVLALIPIVAGIIWTVGFIALVIGTLNLFTVMIMVILLGLGIDFSIHLATRFHEEHVAGKSIEQALYHTLAETGKGVITGALTTATALYTLMIADTKGISEFGFCAGTGVIITLLTVLWVLPALLAYNATRKRAKPLSENAHDFSALGRFAERMGQWRFAIIPIIMLATAAGIWGGFHLDYEWNFNKLEAKGLRSVELQDEIIDRFKFAISFSLLTADSVEESRELRKQFKEKRLVGEVDDISLWVSRPDFEKSKTSLVRLRDALAERQGPIVFSEQRVMTEARAIVEELEANRTMLAEELDRLWMNLVEIQALSIIGGQDRVVAKTEQLVATRENRDDGLLRKIADRFLNAEQIGDDGINWETFDQFTQRFDDSLHSQAVRMTQGEEPVTLAMVPEDIRARYTSKTGMDGFLLRVLPKQNLYEKEELELFQEVAAKIHPNVTGTPQMILEMGLATLQEGKLTSLVAIIAILLLLLIDFRRSPLVAGFAFLPLITGTALMLGVLWLFGEKLNYMNTMALPVIIGIGVDDGVHFFHRLMQEGKGSLRRSMTSVGRAMLMTSLTTMVGFGSLMFYLMQGMQSLGFTLFVGVGMCFIVTITLLPALSVLLEDRIIKEKQLPRRHEVTKN